LTGIAGTDPWFADSSGRASGDCHPHRPQGTRLIWQTALVFGTLGAGCGSNQPTIPSDALSVREALQASPRAHVRLHGYFVAPFDDVGRLCPERAQTDCHPSEGVIVEGVDAAKIPGLELGCCSIGYWSKTEIVLQGRLERGRLIVTPPSPREL
jgi:hypothetical protein